MPGGDGTGPMGMGAMTGRGSGFCAGYGAPGYMNAIPGRGYGFGYGRGRGFGRGLGRAMRGGRQWGGAWGMPYGASAYGGPTPEQEVDLLKGQAEYFEDALEGVRKRLAELEAKAAEKK